LENETKEAERQREIGWAEIQVRRVLWRCQIDVQDEWRLQMNAVAHARSQRKTATKRSCSCHLPQTSPLRCTNQAKWRLTVVSANVIRVALSANCTLRSCDSDEGDLISLLVVGECELDVIIIVGGCIVVAVVVIAIAVAAGGFGCRCFDCVVAVVAVAVPVVTFGVGSVCAPFAVAEPFEFL